MKSALRFLSLLSIIGLSSCGEVSSEISSSNDSGGIMSTNISINSLLMH